MLDHLCQSGLEKVERISRLGGYILQDVTVVD